MQYTTSSPNETIVLFGQRPVVATVRGGRIEGSGRLFLEWLPRPSVIVEATFADPMPFFRLGNDLLSDDAIGLSIPSLDVEAPLSVHDANLGETAAILGSFTHAAIPEHASKCTRVDFELANLPVIWARLPVEKRPDILRTTLKLVAGPWAIEVCVDEHAERVWKQLRATRGYAITHHGTLSRSDGQAFDYKEAARIVDILTWLFSFAFGRWVPPLLVRGTVEGVQVWHELQVRRSDAWEPSITWLDEQHADALEQVFPGLFRLCDDELWSHALHSAIYWYTRANVAASGADTAIVLAQSALELLSWTQLVEGSKTVSRKAFEKMRASERIARLLEDLRIPLGLPDSLDSLSNLAVRHTWSHGPAAIAAVRNSIVHPNIANRLKYTKIMPDAWRLSTWYVELAILALTGFRGEYGSRLRQPRWAGQVERVPWAT